MYILLLAIIYLSFISLGLPDSLLGSAWPAMSAQLGIPLSHAGIISFIITFGTIISSLFSHKITRKFGTATVTALSILLSALSLIAFSFSHSLLLLCLSSVPFGLAAGAVDASLNHYVSQHYSSKHMNWLHCFWGVGASIGPHIIGFSLADGHNWTFGYQIISIIQIILAFIVFASLPLWRNNNDQDSHKHHTNSDVNIVHILRLPGIKHVLFAFFSYCALESTAGLWAGTYLVTVRNLPPETAAIYTSFFYLGITFGRFASGFISNRLGDKRMIRIGSLLTIAGIFFLFIPSASANICLVGLAVTGLGCAPIYPSIIHATPNHFGKSHSGAIVGIQMASAYTGSALMPPIFGFITQFFGTSPYPIFLLAFAFSTLILTERLGKIVQKNTSS